MRAENGHHSRRKVAIKREIRGKASNVVLLYKIFNLVQWDTHFDAQSLDLIGPADYTAVIARQNEDGLFPKVRAKNALATDIEIITVGKRVHQKRRVL